MSEILYKGLAAPLKLDADEWIASLKDDGGEWLPDEKIAKIVVAKFTEAATAATESARDIAHRKGQSEMSTKFSKLIKNSGFENPDNLKGDELFEAYASWKSESASGQPPSATPLDQWTREDLEKLPIVKSLKLEAVQIGAQKFDTLKKEYEATQTEFEKFKRGVVESKTDAIARRRFEAALEKGNVILQPEGLEIDRNERIEAAYHRFKAKYKVGLNKDESPIFINEEGDEVLDLAFGKPLDYDEVAVNVAKLMYGTSTQKAGHAGSGIQQSAQNGKTGAYTPSMRFDNEKAYNEYMTTEFDGANRLEATKSWQHQQSKAAGN